MVLGTLMGVGAPENLKLVVVGVVPWILKMVVVVLEIPREVGAPEFLKVVVVLEILREVGASEFLKVVVVLEIQSSSVVREERSYGCELVQYTWCRWSWCL